MRHQCVKFTDTAADGRREVSRRDRSRVDTGSHRSEQLSMAQGRQRGPRQRRVRRRRVGCTSCSDSWSIGGTIAATASPVAGRLPSLDPLAPSASDRGARKSALTGHVLIVQNVRTEPAHQTRGDVSRERSSKRPSCSRSAIRGEPASERRRSRIARRPLLPLRQKKPAGGGSRARGHGLTKAFDGVEPGGGPPRLDRALVGIAHDPRKPWILK